MHTPVVLVLGRSQPELLSVQDHTLVTCHFQGGRGPSSSCHEALGSSHIDFITRLSAFQARADAET